MTWMRTRLVALALLALALALALPAPAWATDLPVLTATVTAADTHTGDTTYTAITGASIADTSFVAGEPYWIVVTAQVGGPTAGQNYKVRLVHGSTAFAESEVIDGTGVGGVYVVYQFQTVWTAVSSEAITLQFGLLSSSHTVAVDQVSILAIQLSDLTENTDYWWAERSTDDGLSTSPTNGASVTIATPTAGDYLAYSYAQVSQANITTSSISALVRSGEASSATPEARMEASNSSGTASLSYLLARGFTLTATSNTFTEVSTLTSGTAHTRTHSSMFVLRLGAFADAGFAYTDGDTNLGTSSFGTALQSLSVTPTTTGDFVIGGYWGFDGADVSRTASFRLQSAGTDTPDTQTADAYAFRMKDATDERPLPIATVATLSSGASRTITLDGHASSISSTPTGQHRFLWAFSVALGASNSAPSVALVSPSDTGTVTTTTPTLTLICTDPDGDDCRVEVEIADNPDFTDAAVLIASQANSGGLAGVPIHAQAGGGTAWTGDPQQDDRLGQLVQGGGGKVSDFQFHFDAYESATPTPYVETDGEYFVRVYPVNSGFIPSTLANWQATHAYGLADEAKPTSTANSAQHFVYVVTTAGTSAGSEPTWNETEGGTTSDGSVVWTAHEGAGPLNAADPADTPTPDWIAKSDVTAYNPGGTDDGLKSAPFSGANAIRTTLNQWYIGVLDWVPADANTDNIITIQDRYGVFLEGHAYIDGAATGNNGPRVSDRAVFSYYERFASTAYTSGTDSGFANQTSGGDTDPFTSGDTLGYTVQTALEDGVTYYWRARGLDPSGTNTYGSVATTRSFTVALSGGSPTGSQQLLMGVGRRRAGM